MATATLTLHSQAVYTYNGADGNGLTTTGTLRSGDWEFNANATIAATALRFALPSDFDGSETITSAVLNLNAITGVPQTSAGYGSHKSRIRILAESSQVLPTTGSSVSSALGGSEEKTIGEGTYSPVLDYLVTTSYAVKVINIEPMLTQARLAGRLDGGFVVVLIQPVSYDEANYLDAHGSGQGTPPTIDIVYVDASPPPNDYTLVLNQNITAWTANLISEFGRLYVLNKTLINWSVDAIANAQVIELNLDQNISAWTFESTFAIPDTIAVLSGSILPWTIESTAVYTDAFALEVNFPNWTLTSFLAAPLTVVADITLDAWTSNLRIRVGEAFDLELNGDMLAWVSNSFSTDLNLSLFPRSLFPENLHTF